jgi:dipeptidyl aminopeptidase/acylaminoacyl peptidase
MTEINLEKYVDAFCFSNTFVDQDGEKLFYLWQKDNAKKLYVLPLGQERDLKKGELLLDKDFSQGWFEIEDYDKNRNVLYLLLDESNKENFNLWKLNLTTKEFTQITYFNYMAGIVFAEDYSRCWCYDKIKLHDGTFRSDVYEINLSTFDRMFIFNDEGRDYRIGWTPMTKLKDEDAFVFTVDYLNQRKKTNLCKFDLKSRQWEKLLPENLEELGNPSLHEQYPSEDSILFESVHEGFQNVYSYSLMTKSFKKLTDLKTKNEELNVFNRDEGKNILVMMKEEDKFILKKYDSEGDCHTVVLRSPLYLFETKKDFWGIQTGSDQANKIVHLTEAGHEQFSLDLTSVNAELLEHTETNWVSYPSFDGKMVKALLHRPKGNIKAASIVAFYGGTESYSRKVQMYAEMGIATLSPAVRGSWGWGREWEKMLEGDLGGNEILDIIWGAKFLTNELKLPASKIGVHGGSHGGYATLRAITMPDNFKGNKETYFPFGFALSAVGFADLKAFYDDSRIADWLVHLLGPYNEELYKERSPLTFFDNLKTPVFIVNGLNDSRVPYSSIEKFIEKLKSSDKEYELLIHSEQGHGTSNRETALTELKAEYKFLKRFLN